MSKDIDDTIAAKARCEALLLDEKTGDPLDTVEWPNKTLHRCADEIERLTALNAKLIAGLEILRYDAEIHLKGAYNPFAIRVRNETNKILETAKEAK